MLHENVEGILDVTEKMLMTELDDNQKAELQEMMKDIDAIDMESTTTDSNIFSKLKRVLSTH